MENNDLKMYCYLAVLFVTTSSCYGGAAPPTFGPSAVTTTVQTFNICPGNSAVAQYSCTYVTNSVFPGLTMSFTGIPDSPASPTNETNDATNTVISFDFSPTTGGLYTAVCTGVNDDDNMLNATDSKSATVNENPTSIQLTVDQTNTVQNGSTVFMKTGHNSTVECSVSGGYPAVVSTTLTCNSVATTSNSATVSTTFAVDASYDQQKCICTFSHVTSCTGLPETSFTISVTSDDDESQLTRNLIIGFAAVAGVCVIAVTVVVVYKMTCSST